MKESKPTKLKTSKSKDNLLTTKDGNNTTADDVDASIGSGALKKSPNKKNEKNEKKDKSGKILKKPSKHSNKNNRTANMEALELETEQTLKDINRWLEHTPRFPEFNSASNSPTRFNNLLDDFDTVTSKLDPADFRRPLPITTPTNNTNSSGNATLSITTSNTTDQQANKTNSATASHTKSSNTFSKLSLEDSIQTAKENNKPVPKQTIQLTGIPPSPGPHKRDKEPKKKSLKEKIGAMVPKRKDIHRTIERMQPGKTKGNLIGTIHSAKQEEVSILGSLNTNKLKDSKNTLVQESNDSGPKLSLGSVLNTAGFGLIQQHSFADNDNTKGKYNYFHLNKL